MTAIKEFTSRLKFVKREDILQLFPALLGYVVSLFMRIKHNKVWLVCERASDARDNGYWFFKYLCEQHPEIEAVYAIRYDSPDYNKVKDLGRVIEFASFSHWVYYWLAKRNVSSAKEGKPNAALCFIFEVYLGMRKNRAYIRHGIVKDDQKWVYYDVTKMNLFVTSAKREFDYVKSLFGYPDGTVQLLGLCRFDNLLKPHNTKRQILVMPTMREWLRVISYDTFDYEGTYDFKESEFFKVWTSFIHSDKLSYLLDKYDMNLVFYLHASMQHYADDFMSNNSRISIGHAKDNDVQQLLMESAVLITDYSSIYFDFAYMKKTLLYYQFDYEKYRRGQYQEGYFSYKNDGFGDVCQTEDDLFNKLEAILDGNLEMPLLYANRVDEFFAYHDTHNCERTYMAIMNMKNHNNK